MFVLFKCKRARLSISFGTRKKSFLSAFRLWTHNFCCFTIPILFLFFLVFVLYVFLLVSSIKNNIKRCCYTFAACLVSFHMCDFSIQTEQVWSSIVVFYICLFRATNLCVFLVAFFLLLEIVDQRSAHLFTIIRSFHSLFDIQNVNKVLSAQDTHINFIYIPQTFFWMLRTRNHLPLSVVYSI